MVKRALISLAIWSAGILLTVLLYFTMLFFAVILYPFDKKRKVAHAQCFWWADVLIGMNPYWKFTVSGLENIDSERAYVVIANHQSMADITVMYKTKMQFKWVAKKSLFGIPFLGWCMSLAKHICLERGKFSSIKKIYRQAAGWLRAGISVVFFPEGTRSATDEMNEFQNGAFKLAIKEQVPVLPVSIEGTRDAIPKGSWLFGTRIDARLKVMPPIETTQFKPADFERLKEIARASLESAQAA